jgi:putative ABC transport system permease protein
MLALLGGALGLVVARAGVSALVRLSPPNLPRLDAIGLNTSAFVFAIVITTTVGVIVGVAPALAARRTNFRLTIGSTRSMSGRSVAATALVIAEVALALVLLVGAGLLVRSLDQLYGVKSGLDPDRVLTMQIVASGPQYRNNEARLQFFDNVVASVRQVPGVTNAAFTSLLPLSGDGDGYGFQAEDAPTSNRGDDGNASRSEVSPGYFEAMRIPLLRGRLLTVNDVAESEQSIVLNESFARRVFGAQNPIGQHMRFGPDVGSGRPWGTVVGVVGDVHLATLDVPPSPTFYVTGRQWSWVDNAQSLVVRTSGDPLPMADAIKRAVWSVDRTQPIQRIATMEGIIERSVSQRTFASLIFQAFALAALLLAAVGIYGLMASSVAQRTREMGIRAALGATAADIVGQVVRRGVALTACGLMIGAFGAAAASHLLVTMLYGVSRIDPVTYGGVAALLVAVAVVACWVPARRAASVDPAMTLRSE